MRKVRHPIYTKACLNDGTPLYIRPLLPQDKSCLQTGYMCLSKKSRYYRFLTFQSKLNEKQLKYLTEIDYVNHFAIGARLSCESGKGIGIGRYVRISDEPNTAEVALITLDDYQQKGLGTLLLQLLAQYARHNDINTFRGFVLEDNRKLMSFVQKFNPQVNWEGGPVLRLDIPLSGIKTGSCLLQSVHVRDLENIQV